MNYEVLTFVGFVVILIAPKVFEFAGGIVEQYENLIKGFKDEK